VDLVNVKKTGGSRDPKKFGFHEEDTLLHDPVLHMLSSAFSDDAFFNPFGSVGEIYDLVVPPESDRLKLRWKEEWLDRPIFRDVELANGVKISLTKALKYKKVRDHLVRLGRALDTPKGWSSTTFDVDLAKSCTVRPSFYQDWPEYVADTLQRR